MPTWPASPIDTSRLVVSATSASESSASSSSLAAPCTEFVVLWRSLVAAMTGADSGVQIVTNSARGQREWMPFPRWHRTPDKPYRPRSEEHSCIYDAPQCPFQRWTRAQRHESAIDCRTQSLSARHVFALITSGSGSSVGSEGVAPCSSRAHRMVQVLFDGVIPQPQRDLAMLGQMHVTMHVR